MDLPKKVKKRATPAKKTGTTKSIGTYFNRNLSKSRNKAKKEISTSTEEISIENTESQVTILEPSVNKEESTSQQSDTTNTSEMSTTTAGKKRKTYTTKLDNSVKKKTTAKATIKKSVAKKEGFLTSCLKNPPKIAKIENRDKKNQKPIDQQPSTSIIPQKNKKK